MVLKTLYRRHEKGLTLIEVLVALTILGLALLALAPMFTTAVKSNASAYQLTNTTTLAREKLEELSGYPRSDPRLTIANLKNAAFPTGGTPPTGSNAGPCVNDPRNPGFTYCDNDLPKWINPQTGATSNAATRPGIAWFSYPFTRTYTIEQFGDLTKKPTTKSCVTDTDCASLGTDFTCDPVYSPPLCVGPMRITAPNAYVVKLITVTVRPTSGPFPGLRESRQSLYLRFRDA
jgi:prepilin-type N-terminal cleavage/methylation domain-containing protein